MINAVAARLPAKGSAARGEPVRMHLAQSPSDELLLQQVVSGRADAFEALYRRHAQAVMAVAFRVLRDREAAAEVTQTTFLRLWERASRIEPRGGRLRPWLLTVGRNAALDLVRRRRDVVSLEPSPETANLIDRLDVETVVLTRARERAARDVVSLLNEDQRLVVELAFFGDLTQSQIAQSTGIPLGTVKSRIRLAMQRLRGALSEQDWEER